MHGVRVPMWQNQSAGPVRTAHMSVLLTVNIVSHNPARSSSDNIPLNLQTIAITRMLSSGGEGGCVVIEMHWNKKKVFQMLLEIEELFRPESLKKAGVDESIEPKVSTKIGWNRWDWSRSAYWVDFREILVLSQNFRFKWRCHNSCRGYLRNVRYKFCAAFTDSY